MHAFQPHSSIIYSNSYTEGSDTFTFIRSKHRPMCSLSSFVRITTAVSVILIYHILPSSGHSPAPSRVKNVEFTRAHQPHPSNMYQSLPSDCLIHVPTIWQSAQPLSLLDGDYTVAYAQMTKSSVQLKLSLDALMSRISVD